MTQSAIDHMPQSSPQQPHLSPELNGLPQRQPPLSQACWLHGTRLAEDQVSVIASQGALKQILAHGNSNLSAELGGVLLGHAYRHEQRVFVEITAAMPAQTRDHGPVHFTFTADSWADLQQWRAADYPDLDIVGWFHTHPNLGVFFSGDDVVVHMAAFTLPWHVGLVVDPVRQETCFFGWVNGNLAPHNGFYERHEDEAESAVPWRYVSSAVWQDNELPAAYRDAEVGFAAAPGSWFGLPVRWATAGFAAGASALLLGFFLLAAWAFSLNGKVERLETTLLILANEVQADTNAAACASPQLRLIVPESGSNAEVGDQVSLLGTADFPGAARYRVEIRPLGSASWTLIKVLRRDVSFGRLAAWDTSEYPAATYELRLIAVDRNNIILTDSAACLIEVELGS